MHSFQLPRRDSVVPASQPEGTVDWPDVQEQERLLEAFFDRLRHSTRAILFLDYDGTLAPFRVRRDRAKPYPGVVQLLKRIQNVGDRTRLVIVSGRPVQEVANLLGLPRTEIWGAHGWEHLDPKGRLHRESLSPDVARVLEKAELAVHRLGLDKRCERKYASVAFHVRGLRGDLQRSLLSKVETAWVALASTAELQLLKFDGGVELRARGQHKGAVVRRVLSEEDQRGSIPVAYLGDDETDEDAFAALEPPDLAVLVRREYRPTRARVWLRPPQELLRFLRRWLYAVGGLE